MKELTIKDKAELYDKALEIARKEYKNHEAFKGFCEMLVHIFPELNESENEKIRKELLEHCINRRDGKQVCVDANDYKRWADWLEKQGEQNPTWSEYDEKVLQSIILDFKDFKHDNSSSFEAHFDNCIAWLKSLKNRCTWKPTEEQINAIRLARNSFELHNLGDNSTLSKILLELEEQLKKIVEE